VIVYSARARLVARAEEPQRRWLYRAWRLVVEYPQYTTRDISVTTCEMVAVVHRRSCLQHLACCSVNSRHIGSESQFLRTPPAVDDTNDWKADRRDCWSHFTSYRSESQILIEEGYIATPFTIEKLEWCGYPMVKKFRRYLYSFWHNSRMWQTHRQTLHDNIAPCGNKTLCKHRQNRAAWTILQQKTVLH